MNLQEGNLLVSAIDGLVRKGAFIFNKCVLEILSSKSIAKICETSLDHMVISFRKSADNLSQFKNNNKNNSIFDSDEMLHINQKFIGVLTVLFENVIKAKNSCTAYIGILK